MSQRRRRSRREMPPAEPQSRYTLDALERLDREVQMAQDRRHVAHLTVSGAGIPDASPAPLYPGVPEDAVFLPVEPRINMAELVEVQP